METDSDIPQHVAIIMDGNGRWATSRGLPRTEGHRKGADAVRRTVKAAHELGIRYLTLFGFSSENWNRPEDEVDTLMSLMRQYLRSELAELHKNNVRVRMIGERARLAADIVELIENAEEITKNNDGLYVTVAISYGGRQEIVEAVRNVVADIQSGKISPEDIDQEVLSSRLMTAGVPDPDLLIRTSGESRISNFLLWQMAYSELVFVDTYWPDFSKTDLEHACEIYRGRDRRFGRVSGRVTK